MTNFEITVGKVYKIKSGKSIVTATVADLDKTDNSWICETANGKLVVVKSRERDRFLEEVPSEQLSLSAPESQPTSDVKEIFAKANAAKIAAQFGFCTQSDADALLAEANAVAEKLNATVKEKIAKANAAKIAAEHGFCSKEIAESLAKEATEAKDALRAAGRGKVGGSIRSGMSGLDAAYKILLESGKPMNAKSITKIALEQGIWTPQGSTPDMTLSAALQNDVKKKGEQSRFAKADQAGHYIARTVQ
jgi:hypothetical protein